MERVAPHSSLRVRGDSAMVELRTDDDSAANHLDGDLLLEVAMRGVRISVHAGRAAVTPAAAVPSEGTSHGTSHSTSHQPSATATATATATEDTETRRPFTDAVAARRDRTTTGGLSPLSPVPNTMRGGTSTSSRKHKIDVRDYEIDVRRLGDWDQNEIVLMDVQYRLDPHGHPSEACELAVLPLVGEGYLHHHLPTSTVAADTRANDYAARHINGYGPDVRAPCTSATAHLDVDRAVAGKTVVVKGLEKALYVRRVYASARKVFALNDLPSVKQCLGQDHGRCEFHKEHLGLNCASNIVMWMRKQVVARTGGEQMKTVVTNV